MILKPDDSWTFICTSIRQRLQHKWSLVPLYASLDEHMLWMKKRPMLRENVRLSYRLSIHSPLLFGETTEMRSHGMSSGGLVTTVDFFCGTILLRRSLTSMFVLIHNFAVNFFCFAEKRDSIKTAMCEGRSPVMELIFFLLIFISSRIKLIINNVVKVIASKPNWRIIPKNRTINPLQSSLSAFCTLTSNQATKKRESPSAHLFRFETQQKKKHQQSEDCQWSLLIKNHQKELLGCCGTAIICDLWCC